MTPGDEFPIMIDDAAAVWSVAAEERSERLADQPLVIVMHGRGSHENDLAGLFTYLPADAVYVSLRAPISGTPWGLGGWTWFDLDSTSGPTAESVQAAADAVLAWLGRVEAEYGAPPAIATLGFSQGGMMAIQLLRSTPHRFAGAVNLSGASAVGSAAGDGELETLRPPLFWGRDVADPVIAASAIARTEEFVAGRFTVTARVYPGVGHSISADELEHVGDFLRQTLDLEGAAGTAGTAGAASAAD
ncbi:alpha/beta hydrolase [Herbiconiux liangxiaofengii]|uniref:alpha/beta hydrolase n=1 Tax=Herbiconiux liangxiaofengii TaxID=3342795 RepID=UPI0035B7562E